jgi:hypothetical protein
LVLRFHRSRRLPGGDASSDTGLVLLLQEVQPMDERKPLAAHKRRDSHPPEGKALAFSSRVTRVHSFFKHQQIAQTAKWITHLCSLTGYKLNAEIQSVDGLYVQFFFFLIRFAYHVFFAAAAAASIPVRCSRELSTESQYKNFCDTRFICRRV